MSNCFTDSDVKSIEYAILRILKVSTFEAHHQKRLIFIASSWLAKL